MFCLAKLLEGAQPLLEIDQVHFLKAKLCRRLAKLDMERQRARPALVTKGGPSLLASHSDHRPYYPKRRRTRTIRVAGMPAILDQAHSAIAKEGLEVGYDAPLASQWPAVKAHPGLVKQDDEGPKPEMDSTIQL